MSGSGNHELFVSSWGYWDDEDDTRWGRWSVSVCNERVGLLLLPWSYTTDDAYLVACQAFGEHSHNQWHRTQVANGNR